MDQFNDLPQLQRIALLFIPFVITAFAISTIWRMRLAQKLRQSCNKHGVLSSQIVAKYLDHSQQRLQSPLSSILPQYLLYANTVTESIEAIQIIVNHQQKFLSRVMRAAKTITILQVISFYISIGFMINSQFDLRAVNAVIIIFYVTFLVVIILCLVNIFRNDMIQTLFTKKLDTIEEEDLTEVSVYLFLDALEVGDWFYSIIPTLLTFIVPIGGKKL